jgi:hypothetical protein
VSQALDGAQRAADGNCGLTNGLAFATQLAGKLPLLGGQVPSHENLRFESTYGR